MKGNRRPKRGNFRTFTKTWVSRLMYIAVFDIQLSYLLAFLGKEQIAETLSITVVTEIIGVMAVYCMKSFFETKESEKTRLKEKESCMDAAESGDGYE
ncbi:MAG: hypothetical protein NC419_13335 [Muribaculaceae bacterium]|nr:hypothetical protein [Muribaculaceae bacterium]